MILRHFVLLLPEDPRVSRVVGNVEGLFSLRRRLSAIGREKGGRGAGRGGLEVDEG